nr:putative viral replicase [Prune dwarf virus]
MTSSEITAANVHELLVKVLEKQCADETTTVGKAFSEKAKQSLNKTFGLNDESKQLKISFDLTAEQQALLKRHFPGRSVIFSNSSSSSHSFAAAHRLLETDFIYQCFGNTDETILDLGGNYISHLKQRRYNVHCCCPLLDVRDCARHTERLMQYTTYKTSRPDEVHEPNFCESTFQDCSLNGKYAMAIHSTSDLPLGELCESLRRKGVMKFICSVMIDPEMYIKDRGHIDHFNVDWHVDKDKDRIYFDFVDAPCLGYDHKYSTLMEYLHYNAVDLGDSAFRVERKTDFHGVMIIDITYCSGYKPGIELNAGRSCAWLTKLKSKTLVMATDITSVVHPSLEAVSRRHILVDTKVLSRVCEASFRQYKPNVDAQSAIQSICTMLSSATNHCIINGVTMIAGTPLKLEDYVPVATTIYYRVKKIYDAIPRSLGMINNLKTTGEMLDYATKQKGGIPDDRKLFSDYAFEPLRCLLSYVGSTPTRVESYTRDDGSIEQCALYERWGNSWNLFKGFLSGYMEVEGFLVSDPQFFVPLTGVLHMKKLISDAGKVLSVKDLLEEQRALVALKLREQIAEREKAEKSRREYEKAIIQLAAWTKAHPDAKVPKGLSVEEPLMPDVVKKVTTDEVVPDCNPYSDAISEAIDYLRSTAEISKSRLQQLGEHCRWKKYGFSTVWAGDESRRIFLPRENRWAGPTSVRQVGPKAQYERGYTVNGFVNFTWDDAGNVSDACVRSLREYEIVIVDDSCVFSSVEKVIPSLEKALKMNCDFSITIMDGVAGCGKTTKIKSIASMVGDDIDLLLTSNRSSAIELKEAVEGSQLVKSRFIRTCDSYLMTNNAPKAKKMLFDECFMQHAGCIYAAATIAGVSEVIAFGDTEQIPFISRNDMFLLKHHVLKGEHVKQTVTYRNPADTVYALSKFFYRKKTPVKTKRHILRSIKVRPVNALSQVEVDASAVYVTHTQAEKANLLATPSFKSCKIYTTHEVQGGSFDKVIFVRLTRTSNHLYSGKHPIMGACHGLVALSRHKSEFIYYTLAGGDNDDILLKACQYAERADDSDIVKHYV